MCRQAPFARLAAIPDQPRTPLGIVIADSSTVAFGTGRRHRISIMTRSPSITPRTTIEPGAVHADFDSFLAKLGARDRLNIDRHIVACETEPTPDHHRLWRRLALSLFRLAPFAIQTIGQQAVQFFIPDGKYRMQVFAMEDQRDGKILIYTIDILKQAIKEGILTQTRRGAENLTHAYPIKVSLDQTLTVESLDAVNTPNPSLWYKHMLGWNRKALRLSLPTNATAPMILAAEEVCALAARQWAQR